MVLTIDLKIELTNNTTTKHMLSENLYNLRISLNIPIKAMAAKIGLERRTYERYESGERIPDLERLKVIIDVFEIKDIYSFCYGDGSRKVLRKIKRRNKKTIPKLVYKII